MPFSPNSEDSGQFRDPTCRSSKVGLRAARFRDNAVTLLPKFVWTFECPISQRFLVETNFKDTFFLVLIQSPTLGVRHVARSALYTARQYAWRVPSPGTSCKSAGSKNAACKSLCHKISCSCTVLQCQNIDPCLPIIPRYVSPLAVPSVTAGVRTFASPGPNSTDMVALRGCQRGRS